MKSLNTKLLTTTLLFLPLISGCKFGNGPATPALSPAAIQFANKYQVNGCLDVETLMTAILNSSVSHSTITDVKIITDAAPVSRAFQYALAQNIGLNGNLNESPALNSVFRVIQTGCNSISVPSDTPKGNIVSDSIQNPQVTQISTTQQTDSSVIPTSPPTNGYFQISWQVIDAGRVQVTYSSNLALSLHTAATCNNVAVETHEFTVTQILDMNSPYVANDGPSVELQQFKQPPSTSDETNYCAIAHL